MSVRSDNAQFDWKDPFLMESQLSEEERLVRDTARQYAQEKLLPRVRDINETNLFKSIHPVTSVQSTLFYFIHTHTNVWALHI